MHCSKGALAEGDAKLSFVLDAPRLGQLGPAFDGALHAEGTLLGSNKLEAPGQARTVRVREGPASVFDGPFAETKEVLAGYNLVEAASMEEAVELAKQFPWARYGSMEVRPVADMDEERVRVGA